MFTFLLDFDNYLSIINPGTSTICNISCHTYIYHQICRINIKINVRCKDKIKCVIKVEEVSI